ncbi:MAG: GNAT family N-acetyltransferase [Nocardioides sp.]
MKVEPGRPADLSAVEAFLAERNALRVARRGELVSSLDHPTLLAKSDDDLVGVATYVIDAGECELLTLHAHRQLQGIGTALVDAAVEQSARQGRLRPRVAGHHQRQHGCTAFLPAPRLRALCGPSAGRDLEQADIETRDPDNGARYGIELLRDEPRAGEGSLARRRESSPGSPPRRPCLRPPPIVLASGGDVRRGIIVA